MFKKLSTFFAENRAGRVLRSAAVAVFPIYIALSVELLNFASARKLLKFVFVSRTALFLAAVAVYSALFWIALFILRRAWAAAIVFGVPMYIIGGINYYKSLITGSPLFPWDFLFTGETGNILSFVKNVLHPHLYVVLTAVGLLLFIIFFAVSGAGIRTRVYFSAPAAAVLCALILFAYTNEYVRFKIMSKFGLDVVDTVFQTQNYQENGFFGGFTISVGSLLIEKPEGYSEDALVKAFSGYDGTEAGDGYVAPDVIVILSEAFWNPKLLPGTTFSQNPTQVTDEYSAKGISGSILSSVYGGGTVRPEFEVLTGFSVAFFPEGALPYQQYLKCEIDALPSYFRNLGYFTTAIHNYYGDFYDRERAYKLLGFDEFISLEDMPNLYYKGTYPSDDVFMDTLLSTLKRSSSDSEPQFIFGLTVQNHGPYIRKYSEFSIEVQNPTLSEEELSILKNFVQGVYDIDRNMGRLFEYLESIDRPTVVLYFGDHLPLLGYDYSCYYHTGYVSSSNSTNWTDEDVLAMYSVPFFIWSNYKHETGALGTLSPYFLPVVLLDYIESPKTPFYEFLSDFYSRVNAVNYRIAIGKDNEVIEQPLPEDIQNFVYRQNLLQYDMLVGNQYFKKHFSK